MNNNTKLALRSNNNNNRIFFFSFAIICLCSLAPFVRLVIASRGLSFWAILVAVPCIAIGIFLNRNYEISTFQILIFAFLILHIVNITWHSGFNFDNIKVQITAILLFSYMMNKKDEKIVCFIAVLTAIFFIYAYFFMFEYYGGGVRRYIHLQDRIYLDPNMVSANFIVPTAYIMQLMFSDSKKVYKILGITFIGFSIYAIITSGSRGGLITIAIIILIYLFYNIKNAQKFIPVAIIAFVVIMIFSPKIIELLPEGLLDRFTIVGIKNSGGGGRFELYDAALSYIEKENNIAKILFGYGMGSSPNYIGMQIHNTIMDYIWGMGLLGLSLYAIFHGFIFIYCIKSKNLMSISCIIATLVWSMTISASNQFIYWVLLYEAICFAQNEIKV